MPARSSILIVDDEAEEVRNQMAAWGNPALIENVEVLSPEDIAKRHIEDADLVLVDLTLSKWVENAQCECLSRTVPNGIALAAILQQHAVECERPTAFALHSAHLLDLTKPFPPLERVHLIARTYNVEWAFLKSTPDKSPAELFPKIRILADAVAALPAKWPENNTEKARDIARRLLAVPDNERWSHQGWEDAEAARPPLDELTLRIHGILFLRWLLTRVLYYPCFLLDRYWVAARLGATPQS